MNTYPNAQYPHTIQVGEAEKLTYTRFVEDENGGYLECVNEVAPNAGPPMHVHWQQEESLTIVEGKMGVEIMGQGTQFFGPGDTASFKPGVYHRFWNAGETPLKCTGFIKPALNFEYFLTNIYQSTNENGGHRPGTFDSAFLLDRYRTEFDMASIPKFVKKVIFPITLKLGKLRGKHRKFSDAPAPIK
jgi:quercetin dioxygenase-like cupin family protein